jgi:hypothetical protein
MLPRVLLTNKWRQQFPHCSVELLEMQADPWIKRCAQGAEGKIYALEVCDPVKADGFGYAMGVLVSEFVTPAWLEHTQADRLDFKNAIEKPLELAPGGYIGVLDSGKGWTQMAEYGFGGPPCPIGSRRDRRGINRREWRNSKRPRKRRSACAAVGS